MICDVSKHQGKIDWDLLAPELDFVMIKASGRYENDADPYYAKNVAGAVEHNISFHAYHFLYCLNEMEAKRDAGLFYNTVVRQGHMPLFWVLDCEAAWGIANDKAKHIAELFEAELRRLAGGDIRVAMYVAQQKYYSYGFDYDHYAYVWIPGYGEAFKPKMPCDIWQYTSDGRLPGINGRVDLNKIISDKPMSYFTTKADTTDKKTSGGDAGMLTGRQLAEYCEKAYKAGWVYWYGTYGQLCSESLYNSKKNQYPNHYTSDRASGYRKDIESGKRCADCVGLIKSFFWTGGKFDTTPKYASNGCPDKSANGMIEYCSETGPISTIPDEPGLVVWKSGHIGVYVGGGYTVELMGFAYDCRRKKVTDGTWTKWGRLPASMISYDKSIVEPSEPSEEPSEPSEPSVSVSLKKGAYGPAVTIMQQALLKWDPKCLPRYGADGDFGSETEKAIKAYQSSVGLPVTGIYDEITEKYLTDIKNTKPRYVVVTGNSVNVRTAPNTTTGRILGIVHKDYQLPYQGQDSDAGWHLVIYDGQNAWISGKYSKVV